MNSVQSYVIEHAIHEYFAKNAPHPETHSVHFEAENLDWKGGFNSNTIFGRVIYEEEKGKKYGDSIVLKVMMSSEMRSKFMDLTFCNEIYVYSRIIPFFAKANKNIWNMFPKFYYGSTSFTCGRRSDNETALIVLENLSASGYRMTKTRSFLSIEELRLIVKRLAHFHSYSYYFKNKSPKEFYSMVSNLVETHYVDTMERLGSINVAGDHHIDILSKNERYREKAELIRGILEDGDEFIRRVHKTAKEPMTVVCHGDFLRNNLMIKYNPDGLPEDVKFFDLAWCRYCSPIVDLALILYMNTDQKTRDLYWDELIDTYCTSLHELFPDTQVPSREQVVEEFKINSLYAFVIVSFFLPQMMRYDEIPNYQMNEKDYYLPEFEEFLNASFYEVPVYVIREVFKKATKPHYEQVVLAVLTDIIDRGFV